MKNRMRNRTLTISINVVFAIMVMVFQSCDSTVNIEEPQQFYKYIGTEGDQWSTDMVIDAEDNIYILGRSSSTSDGLQLYAIKTTSKGIVIWEKIFGEAGDETPKDIELLSDGNLILVADRDMAGEKDFVIYRLNASDGSVIGAPINGGNPIPGTAEYVNSITQISTGFIVSSYVDNGVYKEAYVYRYDVDLLKIPTLFWNVTFSQEVVAGGYDFVPVKVIQMTTDLFYTFCYTNTTLGGDNIPDYNFFVYVSGELNDLTNALAIPGLDPNSGERLTSVRAVPPQSGSGFVLVGYSSSPTTNQQDLYALKIVQDLKNIKPSQINSIRQGPPRVVTSGLSSITSASNASVYPSKGEGFLLLGDQNSQGNDNIYLTKVDNSLDGAWSDPHAFFSFGGAGNDLSGAVVETSDGRILLCGTMVLGDVIGQKKVVLMNLSPNGLFGE
jgi:hypothetical protein